VSLIRLASRIFGTPHAIELSKLRGILSVLQSRLELDPGTVLAGQFDLQTRNGKPYSVDDRGAAVISIAGTLIGKTYGLAPESGLCSYASISSAFSKALTDPAVTGVLLDIDSPGGEASSEMLALADLIYSARGSKPVFAVANDLAASAAYLVASAADRLFVTQMGAVGSVGVYAVHIDQSGFDKKQGVRYSFVSAGAKKVDGNPHEPLSEPARDDLQAEIDREYDILAEITARNRRVQISAIKSTGAALFFGETALPLLADQVGTFDDALGALHEHARALQSRPSTERGKSKGDRSSAIARQQANAREIATLCAIAGRPELCCDFIERDYAPEQVIEELLVLQNPAASDLIRDADFEQEWPQYVQ